MAPNYGVSHLLERYSFSHTGFFYLLGSIVGLYLIYIVSSIVYELYFSPLSKLPGRKSWIAFPILRHVTAIRGNLDSEILKIHEKYGDIVRLGPNEVSFTTADAWQDIYGHGHSQLPKVVRWDQKSTPNVLFTDNDEYHTRYRKALAYGFSDKALRQQESLIKVYVDLLIEKMKDVASSTSRTDMVRWYNLCTFDVIGDLSFGQSFGGLQNTKMHEWVSNVFLFTKIGMVIKLKNAYPLIGAVASLFTPKSLLEARKTQESFARVVVTKRINNTQQHGRSDFMDSMLRHKGDKDELSFEEIVSNANVLILAGSETTATLLSGATYWLLKTPDALKKAVDEVRTQFEREEDITFISTANSLPYMVACLEESLRIYPPAASHFPRRTLPGAPTKISGVEVPPNTVVSVHHLSTYWSPRNFHEPLSFHPERWLREAATDPTSPFYNDIRAARQPFSLGPRNCVGRNLAYNEMRLILARVLWNFDLELCHESDNWHNQKSYVIWEKDPLWVKVKRRPGSG